MKRIKRKSQKGDFSEILLVGALILGLFLFYKKEISAFVAKSKNAIVEVAFESNTSKDPAATAEAALAEDPFFNREVFGYSTKGKPLDGYVIGKGSDVIFLLASIHGNEMGGAELLKDYVEKIKANPAMVPGSKKLVILPVANPDGYFDRVDKLNANGVNLNLNFSTKDWSEYGPEGNYAGPKPFSEKESQVIKSIVEKYKPKTMISYHSYGSLVTPEENTASINFANWYVAQVYNRYVYYNDWDYPGTATKWFVQSGGVRAITVELSNHETSDWSINNRALDNLLVKNF
jgi:hypothetical protein